MNARAVLSLLFAAVCAAMLGLAAGAVWMLPTLYFRHPLPVLALLAGAVLGWVVRSWVRPPGLVAAALAAFATLTATVYANLLIAAFRVGGQMGMGLVDTLRVGGLGLLWQLAWLGHRLPDTVYTLAGMGIAAALAGRVRRRVAMP